MAFVPPIEDRYRAPHHYPEAVFVNAPSDTSISRLSVPAYVVVGGLFAVGTGCLALGMGYMSLINKIERVPEMVKVQIESLTKDFSQRIDVQSSRVDRIENEMASRTADRYTRTDHDRWCKTAELVNTASGWKCPDVEKRIEFAPQLKGWGADKK